MEIVSLRGIPRERWTETLKDRVEALPVGGMLLGRAVNGTGGVLVRQPWPNESDIEALAIATVAAAHAYADFAAVPGQPAVRVRTKDGDMLDEISRALSAETGL